MAFDAPHFLFPFLSSSYPTGPFDIDGSGLAPCVDCPLSLLPVFLSGYLESFRLRSSFGVAYLSISTSISFPSTYLDTTPAQAAFIYHSLHPKIHTPRPCICTARLTASLFPMNMVSSFSFVHTLLFHCTLSLAPAAPAFVYLLSPISRDISLFYSSSSIRVGIFVHSLPFLYYFTILFGVLPRLIYWAGWVSGLVDLSDCNISPTAISLLHIHLSCIILVNTNPQFFSSLKPFYYLGDQGMQQTLNHRHIKMIIPVHRGAVLLFLTDARQHT